MYDQALVDQWRSEDLADNGFIPEAIGNNRKDTHVDNEGNKVEQSDIAQSFTADDYDGIEYHQTLHVNEVIPNFNKQHSYNSTTGYQISSYTVTYTLNEHILASWKNSNGESLGITSTSMVSNHSGLFHRNGIRIESLEDRALPKIKTGEIWTPRPVKAAVSVEYLGFDGTRRQTNTRTVDIGRRVINVEGAERIRRAVVTTNSVIN
ncbi:MAG: hypothetical protein ACOYXT_02935, partial [Bacteroidota bacterium]